ncbi:MAG: methylenetetrahydrofolate reductase [NAD(P)H] [Roseburia sp.]|nr:methylenetetrahydrofolate reductase [NAD(P)H] [Ruminococcus sp.]MCM1155286.1 methylenetetrahydrofolate reductase [NAD(P)H] [Roseburia sp.]MCM1243714.1 methylenetetrahydrofolate reductase [NAD(P)H] [Roseburia sp.]
MVSEVFKQNRCSLSFEVSPPKTEDEFQAIFGKLDAMAALHPDFISCTYGAGGSRAGKTVEIASYIQRQLHIDAIAHMTCVGFKQADLQKNCEALQKEGIRHVMALRGDRPFAMTDEQYNSREFFYASDMIRYLKANTDLEIAGACYPEKHYEAESFEADLKHLKEKTDAGAAFLITQLFFSNDIFYRFLDKAKNAGITVPVCAGIMPITSAKQIGTSVTLSGSSVPKELADIIANYGEDKDDMRKAGIDYAVRQIRDLKEHGVDGIHIYTMNRPKTTAEIVAQI